MGKFHLGLGGDVGGDDAELVLIQAGSRGASMLQPSSWDARCGESALRCQPAGVRDIRARRLRVSKRHARRVTSPSTKWNRSPRFEAHHLAQVVDDLEALPERAPAPVAWASCGRRKSGGILVVVVPRIDEAGHRHVRDDIDQPELFRPAARRWRRARAVIEPADAPP